MRSPPSTLPPKPPGKPPEWLVIALTGVIAVVTILLLVFIGWPMLALLLFGINLGAGVLIGYRGARNNDFTRIVGKWLE